MLRPILEKERQRMEWIDITLLELVWLAQDHNVYGTFVHKVA